MFPTSGWTRRNLPSFQITRVQRDGFDRVIGLDRVERVGKVGVQYRQQREEVFARKLVSPWPDRFEKLCPGRFQDGVLEPLRFDGAVAPTQSGEALI